MRFRNININNNNNNRTNSINPCVLTSKAKRNANIIKNIYFLSSWIIKILTHILTVLHLISRKK